MAIAQYIKDPASDLDYTQDWSKWLAPGDTITSVTASQPQPSFLNSDYATPVTYVPLLIQSISHTDTETTLWISQGTEGMFFDVVIRVTTAGGRVDRRTITIVVKSQ